MKKTAMKRILALALALAMMMLITTCAFAQETNEVNTGEWTIPENHEVTEEIREAFKKALQDEGVLGVEIEPVRVMGTQIVNGTMVELLCRRTVVGTDAQAMIIVKLWMKTDGTATITAIDAVPEN